MKTALITGATFGIGYELAKIFARENHNLILVARNLEKLNQIKSELLKPGIFIYTIQKDLTSPNSPVELYNEVKQNNFQVDILINNAGFGLLEPFVELDLKSQLDMIQLNITSLVHLTHLFLPEMIQRKNGKIMNVASTAAFQPGPNIAIYYATKAFVLSFSEVLNAELKGTGVSVSALCPGPTKTEFQKRATMANINLERTKLIPYMSAGKVARIGYNGLMKNKRVIIPGLMNKTGAILVKFLPKSIILAVLKKFNTRN